MLEIEQCSAYIAGVQCLLTRLPPLLINTSFSIHKRKYVLPTFLSNLLCGYSIVIYTLFHFEKEFKPIQKILCIFFSSLSNFLQIIIIFVCFQLSSNSKSTAWEKKKPTKFFNATIHHLTILISVFANSSHGAGRQQSCHIY